MTSIAEKGGSGFSGIKLLLCENPLPPIEEAIAAAQAEVPHSNYYTEPYSAPLRQLLSERLGVPERLIHINAGSELILRQMFDRFGQQVHLLTPTYVLFPEIAGHYTETRLPPDQDFAFDLGNWSSRRAPPSPSSSIPTIPMAGFSTWRPCRTCCAGIRARASWSTKPSSAWPGESVVHLVPDHPNLLVTRTLSKAHSLAGFRIGYGIFPEDVADDLNGHNDAYPLARPSQAAALATLQHEDKIHQRAAQLRLWTEALAAELRALGVRTFATQTYFFLADFAPHSAADIADAMRSRDILIKPLNDPALGPGFMRVTTALPEDNRRFVDALKELLGRA
jgi:histidinol-phosphate aminotransferase